MDNIDNLIPSACNDQVLVKLFPKKQKVQGRIVLPENQQKKIEKGVITSVGPGLDVYNDGKIITISLRYSVGDIVGIPMMGRTLVESTDDGDIVSIKAQDIITVYKEDNE